MSPLKFLWRIEKERELDKEVVISGEVVTNKGEEVNARDEQRTVLVVPLDQTHTAEAWAAARKPTRGLFGSNNRRSLSTKFPGDPVRAGGAYAQSDRRTDYAKGDREVKRVQTIQTSQGILVIEAISFPDKK